MTMDSSETRLLAAMLDQASKTADKRVKVVVRKTGQDIVRDAKILAPYEFGVLRNSIAASPLRGGQGDYEMEIGPTAHYGYFQEFGTSRMPPQPFMNPAADRQEGAFLQAMAQLGEEALGG